MANIYGTPARNEIQGTAQDDTIYGDYVEHWKVEGSRDIIFSGIGNDRIYGGGGDDKLYGEGGNDILSGGHGNDYLNGGAGNDQISGNAGNDYLTGGSGNDLFNDFEGNNTFMGGRGADTFLLGLFTDNFGKPFTGVNTIKDFNAKEGDKLHFVIDAPSETHIAISDFIRAKTVNGSTHISIDLDGNGSQKAVLVAKLDGIVNFDVEDAIHKGSVIV